MVLTILVLALVVVKRGLVVTWKGPRLYKFVLQNVRYLFCNINYSFRKIWLKVIDHGWRLQSCHWYSCRLWVLIIWNTWFFDWCVYVLCLSYHASSSLWRVWNRLVESLRATWIYWWCVLKFLRSEKMQLYL
jgi:hypothetical protein